MPLNFVCPKTYECLSINENDGTGLATSSANEYEIRSGILDLNIRKELGSVRHHRRRIEFGKPGLFDGHLRSSGIALYGRFPFAVGSYEEELGALQKAPNYLQKIYERRVGRQVKQFQIDVLDRVFSKLDELFPIDDNGTEEIDFESLPYGKDFAQSLFLALAKQNFWAHLEIPADAVEAGIHNGIASQYLWDNTEFEVGIDFVFDMLVANKNKFGHKKIATSNIFHLPFENESVGALFANGTISCCYGSTFDLLDEINRVMKPGGEFAFTVPGPAWRDLMQRDFALGDGFLSPYEKIAFDDLRSSYMAHIYSFEEWVRALDRYGFDLIKSAGFISRTVGQISQLFHNSENCGMGLLHLDGSSETLMKMSSVFNRMYNYDAHIKQENHWDTDRFAYGGIVAKKR